MKRIIFGIILIMLLTSMLALAFSIQQFEKDGITSDLADSSVSLDNKSGGYGTQSSSVDWWPMFQHDLRHTGHSTAKAPETNETLWTYTAGGPLRCYSPTVAEDRVYFGSDDKKVYCVNATSGAFIWSYLTPRDVTSAPAIADGKVYTGVNDGTVLCLNATTGAFIWVTGTLSNYIPGGPVFDNGRVYIGGADNRVFFCLNATTGATLWTYNANGNIYFCSPAVADGFVYFTDSWGNKVHCLNATTGAFKWSYTLGNRGSWGSTAVVDGIVYLGSTDSRVIALNASTGALVWSYATGEVWSSSPAVVDGKLYIGSTDDKVYCLNASSGAFKWSYTTGNDVTSSPAVADGKVYIPSNDNHIFCLNATTGAFKWSYSCPFIGSSNSPAIANGVVYVCTYNGGSPSPLIAFGSHDVAVTNVTASTAEPYPRQVVDITVVAKNEGTHFNESFDVNTYYDSTLIGTQTVTDLGPEEEKTLIFSWNTTDIAGGYYTISANASMVLGETHTTDNSFIDGVVKVIDPLNIKEVIPCNQTGYPKNVFQLGTMAFIKVTINSTALTPQNTLITVNLYDYDHITIGVASFQGPILSGISTVIFGLPIPTTATIGTATVYANCYTDWPSQGGFPHCPEISATLEITGP